MIWISSATGSSKLVGRSPSAITGKSSRGSVGRLKFERPALTCILPSAAARLTSAPSGSLRAISNKVCADTVVVPAVSTLAAIVSTTCKSRSVAISFSWPDASASIRTFDRMGMVLRRSTTDWTWPRLFNNTARSIVAFILIRHPCVPREKSLKGPPSKAIRRPDSRPLKMPTFLNARVGTCKPCLQSIPNRANEGAMRRWTFFFMMLAALPAAALAAAPTALGIFDGWGAFRDPATPRCYALAAPSATIGTPQVKAYASVGYWPKSRIRGDPAVSLCQRRLLAQIAHPRQFYVRLSKARAPGRDLRLTIGSRRFILTGNGAHGWASDPRMDAAIVAAMRSAPSMSVASSTASGGAIADTYRLRGAATAIDAAALGCARLG